MLFDIDLGKVAITPGGSWNAGTRYEKLTLVTHNGQSYISRIDNQGVTPGTDPATWQLVAAKGQDGSGGSDGGGSVIPGTSDVIGLAFYEDGNLYWTRNGEWLLDPNGNMVRANAIDGQSAVAPNTSFKSIVFKRSNSNVDTPTGGSYASPVPDGWSDGVPSGKEQLWMSTRVFSSDGNSPQQASWTTPVPVTDTEFMDYEFSSADNPGIPSKSTPSGPEQNPAWSNEADATTIWMAMREVKNGAYAPGSSWKVLRIKGEKGEDGTSVNIQGHLDDTSLLPLSGNTEGDGYIIDGNLWVWDGDSWENAGPIQGPPGVDGRTPYVHIKYSNDGGQTFTANNGETPGDYIGIYTDYEAADSSNPESYTWKNWKGEDGFGYEYIFKLTANDTAPDVPSSNAQRDDFVPTGWTDNPGNVSASYPFCWVCYRKKTDGEWGNWIGSSSNAGKAALYSHYGKDGSQGKGIASINEKYAVSNSATTAPSSWSDNVPQLTAVNRYLWNYEIITYTDGDSISTAPAVIGTYGSGRGIESITEYYLASASSSGVTRNTQGWGQEVQNVSASRPYLWNYEVITYTDGTSDTSEPFVIGHFGSDGADGTPGIGITAVYEKYLISDRDSGITTSNSGWQTTPPSPTPAKPYLWNYETMVYSDGSMVNMQPRIVGRYGKDGADGRGISSVTNYYLATSLTNVTRNTSGWMTSPPTIGATKPYLWNYEMITYDDGEKEYTSPVIIGVYGAGASDTSYLEEVFGEDHVSGEEGAILRNLLGVTGSSDKVVAMMNASDIGADNTHGRLMFAAGMNGVASQAGIDAAKFKVYEDGQVHVVDLVGVNVTVSGTVNAVAGTIGPFSIDGYNGLTANISSGANASRFELTPDHLLFGFGANDLGGFFKVGNSDCVAQINTQDDIPALILRCNQGETALLIEGGIEMDDGDLSLGINSIITGFKCGIYTVSSNNASVNISNAYHSFVNRTFAGVTFRLPSSPSRGEEYEFYVNADSTLTSQNNKQIENVYGGSGTPAGQGVTSTTLTAGYRYKVIYNGTYWFLSRS